MTDDRVRAAYDLVAADYARLLPDTAVEAPFELGAVAQFVADVGPDARVLDAGCGAGRLLTHLHAVAPSWRLDGVDMSIGMVAEARRVAPFAEVVAGSLDALPFADAAFDAVLAWYSIIHTPTDGLHAIAGELARVLRPGGHVLLAFQSGSGARDISRAYGHELDLTAFRHTVATVGASLERTGFTVTADGTRTARGGEREAQAFVLARC
ncbi:class I SAM-dependent methyltransferase [Microbacterium gorillae]|uniref:class I SAM-dependent methyltransferase n=1 Tax=Microbacterium gorillae TaxID=1231063 RepID=UPI000590D2C0|nr:class I SAM-dependent methyltransferase [Microbacterium gorillae]